MNRRQEIRGKALRDLQHYAVLMLDGHFDFGNGYHGAVYLNPHQLFRWPSTIWRFAQDLLDVLPAPVTEAAEVVAGESAGFCFAVFGEGGGEVFQCHVAMAAVEMPREPSGAAAEPGDELERQD